MNFRNIAKVAQLVEHNLAKVRVAGSSPVFRSTPINLKTFSKPLVWKMFLSLILPKDPKKHAEILKILFYLLKSRKKFVV